MICHVLKLVPAMAAAAMLSNGLLMAESERIDWSLRLDHAIQNKDVSAEVRARYEIGRVLQSQGNLKLCVDQLVRAIDLANQNPGMAENLRAQSMLGSAFTMMRQPQRAAAVLLPAANSALAKNDPSLVATTLNDLGHLMASLDEGTTPFTLSHFNKMLGSSKQIDYPIWSDHEWRHAVLLPAESKLSIDNMEQLFKPTDDGVVVFSSALEMAERAGAIDQASRIAINLSRLQRSRGQSLEAEKSLRRARSHVNNLEPTIGKAFLLLALSHSYSGQTPESADSAKLQFLDVSEALRIARKSKDSRLECLSLKQLAKLYESEKRQDESLVLTRQAVFAAQKIGAKDLLYQLQWQTGRLLRQLGQIDAAIRSYQMAIRTLESQDLRHDLATGYGNHAGVTSFRANVGNLFYEHADLILQRALANRDSLSNEQLQVQLLLARQTVERLKSAELSNYFQSDCAALISEKAKGIDNIVSTGTAIIYLIPLDDRLEILVSLENNRLEWKSVNVTAKELKTTVNLFRNSLTDLINETYDEHANKLYVWLIKPIAPLLHEQQIKTLVFVPDGALRTVPMAALMNGDKHLIEEFAVAITPGLKLTEPEPFKRENASILLNGLSEGIDGFTPLPNVPAELKQIAAAFGQRNTLLLNHDFIVNNVDDSVRAQPFSIVHIASHGHFSSNLQDTYILTHEGYANRMTLDKLENLIRPAQFRFDKQPIELLTLSACDTAVGDDRAALGLAGIAVKAGARSAVASLWPVQDEETSIMMAKFYEHLLSQKEKMSKAEALQAAQIYILQEVEYHPYYWSAFLLIGNWQ